MSQVNERLTKVRVMYLMSITRGVFAQSPEPEAHDKVLDNNPDRIGIWKYWFSVEERGNPEISRSKDDNQQQTQPTYDAESGNRTGATLVGGEYSHHCAIPFPFNRSALICPRMLHNDAILKLYNFR